jgi:hypothetical protein
MRNTWLKPEIIPGGIGLAPHCVCGCASGAGGGAGSGGAETD